ncbi:MAG: c-type cytochrome [Pirellulales bacterium]
MTPLRHATTACLTVACLLCGLLLSNGAAAAADESATVDIDSVVLTLELVADADAEATRQCLKVLSEKIESREVAAETRRVLAERLEPILKSLMSRDAADSPRDDAALLAASLKMPPGIAAAEKMARDGRLSVDLRRRALGSLIFSNVVDISALASDLLDANRGESLEARTSLLGQLGRAGDNRLAATVLRRYAGFEPELKPKAIELLTQRPAWSHVLLDAIAQGDIPANSLNVNQVTRLLASKDEALKKRVAAIWGTVRAERNPQREQLIARVREELMTAKSDPHRGQRVFQRVCGQCHKIHGEGQEVGPDITLNGRSNLEQLLSNVLDPSLVIGASYQARIVVTSDGRVLTGLLVEDSPQRVALKIQGGKIELIGRDDIEELRISPLSLMPEGLETQLQPQELWDLFAFLTLDKPPNDAAARRIPDR